VEFCIFVEPQQGGTYDQQSRVARAAEAAGFEGFFRSDHFMRIGSGDPGPGPTDAWVTLGAIARETSRVRLGTLVTNATLRHPGVFAVVVAEVDAMSGGRVELGIGAGWYEAEHEALGVPFPPVGERFERLEEQLQILTGLWSSEGPFNFEGRHYRLQDNPAIPKPAQRPHPPLIIGGLGPKRTPRLAATYAAEYNIFTPTVGMFEERLATVGAACEANGRDPASLRMTIVQTICCGRDDDEVRRRAKKIGRNPDEMRDVNAVGTPAELVEHFSRWSDRGVVRVYLQLLDMDDLEQVELLGSEVVAPLQKVAPAG
jgi:F420-dependent oxidoreductase-like protein